jgi:hypothetical protein
VWPLEEPSLFRGLQHLDRRRFRSGKPHLLAPSLAAA